MGVSDNSLLEASKSVKTHKRTRRGSRANSTTSKSSNHNSEKSQSITKKTLTSKLKDGYYDDERTPNENFVEKWPKYDDVKYGVVMKTIRDEVTIVILYPDSSFYCLRMHRDKFPFGTPIGRWCKFLFGVDSDKNQYVKNCEMISSLRPTRVIDGSLEIATKISVHPATKYLLCEFGKLVMPSRSTVDAIAQQKEAIYWCRFYSSPSNNRLTVIQPYVVQKKKLLNPETALSQVTSSIKLPTSTTRRPDRKYGEKLSGDALCIAIKGEEAIMLVLMEKWRFERYCIKYRQFSQLMLGQWCFIKYQLFSTSTQHANLLMAEPLNKDIRIPTRRIGNEIHIRTRLRYSLSGDLICDYGRVGGISNENLQKVEMRLRANFKSDEAKEANKDDVKHVEAWVFPGPKMLYNVVALCNDELLNGEGYEQKLVKHKENTSNQQSTHVTKSLPKKARGVICAEYKDIFYVYSVDLELEAIFDMTNNCEKTEKFHLGDWVEFYYFASLYHKCSKNNEIESMTKCEEDCRMVTIPGNNTVYMETLLYVPPNFLTEEEPIVCEVAPQMRIVDEHKLINKDSDPKLSSRFVNARLRAVLSYVYHTNELCGFWRIEAIRRAMK